MAGKILIADDDGALRALLVHVVRRAGFEAVEAADGNMVLLRLAQRGVALALLDAVMPEKEGIETLLEIRRSHPHLPVVVMSGGGRAEAGDPLSLAMSCGATAVAS